jgi:hypothetical protein
MASVLLAKGGTSRAQMGYTAASLEWLVANSDVVVRASVDRIKPTPVVQVKEGVYRNPEVWKTVTLKVHETLKGDPTESLTFVERTLAADGIYEGWRDAGREQLWLLVRQEKDGDDAEAPRVSASLRPYGGGWSVIRLGPPVSEERGFSSLPPPIFTLDLKVLKEPKDILKAARAAVAETGKRERIHSHAVDLPRGIMQATGRSGDVNRLIVLIDHRLEAVARHWIESPEEIPLRLGVIKPEDHKTIKLYSDLLRAEGVRALRHFKSNKNVATLKGLLDDPAFWLQRNEEDDRAGITEKVYYVRQAAFETLREWGVEVEEPVLKESLPQR